MTVTWPAIREMFSARKFLGTLLLLGVMGAVTVINAILLDYPVAFLFFPAVLLLTFQRGFAGGALGMFLASAYLMTRVWVGQVLGWLGYHSMVEQIMIVQLFVAVLVFSVVLVGAVLEERRRAQQNLAAAMERAELAREEALAARQEAFVAREAAMEANRSKSMFLANMSHELRTPLNAVIGFSQTMQDEVFGPLGNERYKEYSGLIAKAGAHLLDLINDILDMSRIEAGKFEIHLEPLDVVPLVGECVGLMKDTALQAGLTLTFGKPAGPVAIHADPRALKQILLNLLANAVKFTPSGGQVEVNITRLPGEIELVVCDNGIGIPSDKVPRAGDPFVQFHQKSGKQGAGLGLALVRSLAQMHGGTVRIESREGEGTLVAVSLPAAIPNKAAA